MTTTNTLALPAPTMLSVNIPFSGFYGSIWEDALDREHEQTCEHWQSEDGRESFSAQFPELAIWRDEMGNHEWSELFDALFSRTDYRKAFGEIAKDYAEAFANWLADSLDRSSWIDAPWSYTTEEGEVRTVAHRNYERGIAYEWEEMVSPREYNFGTDRLFAKFSLSDLDAMKRRLDAAELDEQARQRFTSYDGFISSYNPDWHTWPEDLEDWDHNQLGTIVVAYVAHEFSHSKFPHQDLEDELYEAVRPDEQYFDNAVDWPKLAHDAEDIAHELEAEVRRHDPDFDPMTLPAPRCPNTPDLFAGRA